MISHAAEPIWTFTLPDGSAMAATGPETVERKLQMIDFWYRGQISPFVTARAKAEFEVVTGEKFDG